MTLQDCQQDELNTTRHPPQNLQLQTPPHPPKHKKNWVLESGDLLNFAKKVLLLHNDSAAEEQIAAIEGGGLAGCNGGKWFVELNMQGVI